MKITCPSGVSSEFKGENQKDDYNDREMLKYRWIFVLGVLEVKVTI